MTIRIVKDCVTKEELAALAKDQFGDMMKAVVDIDKGFMAIGAELHADEEAVLLDQGSRQEALWGINLYPQKNDDSWIEFDSMINLRPSNGNRSRGVDSPEIRRKIQEVVKRLVP